MNENIKQGKFIQKFLDQLFSNKLSESGLNSSQG